MPVKVQDLVDTRRMQVNDALERLKGIELLLCMTVTIPMLLTLVIAGFCDIAADVKLALRLGFLCSTVALVVFLQMRMLRRQMRVVASQLKDCAAVTSCDLKSYLKKEHRTNGCVERLDERMAAILDGGSDNPNSIRKLLDLNRFLWNCFHVLVAGSGICYLVLPWLSKLITTATK